MRLGALDGIYYTPVTNKNDVKEFCPPSRR
jgi:hypothetical protein